MRRAFVTSIDRGIQGIAIHDVEAPRLGPGEARVSMAFAPINPADLLLVTGRHVYRPELPSPIGIEGSGTIVEVGAGVDGALVGRKVALPFGGTWSQEIVLAAAELLVLPDQVDMEQAAMFSVNPFTVLGLLDGLAPGAVVLQNAAASAVGKLVIRLARRRGLTTINVVRRQEQVDELKSLGADVVLVGDTDLAERVRPHGPVVRALDAVAGEGSRALFSAVADGGTLLVYGLLSDDRVILPANELVFRDVTVKGYSRLRVLRSFSAEKRKAIVDELVGALAEGHLTTAIDATIPLSRIDDALTAHAREGRGGKVMLDLQR